MRFRAVLFDLFDTLVDLRLESLPTLEIGGRAYRTTYRLLHDAIVQRVPVEFESFASALAEVDRELRDQYYARGRELPTVERFRGLLARLAILDAGLAEVLTEVHMGALRAQAVYLEHHAEVLRGLRLHLRLGVVSNFSHSPTALAILERAGLRPHLDAVVISDRGGIRKPRREIFQEALGELGVEPAGTLHVGDDLRADVAGARGAGLAAAWLTRRVADPERALAAHQGPPPDWILGDLRELPALLGASGGA